MANYLYKTTIYKNEGGVVGIDPDNSTNLSDYENNHQADTMKVDELQLAETTFAVVISYATFDGYITTPYDWGDVKEDESDRHYDLYLITGSPLE